MGSRRTIAMKVTPVKTHKIVTTDNLFDVLDKYITELENQSIVAVTSKIVSVTEGRVVKIEDANKDELIKSQSEYFLPRETNPYHVSLTITSDTLIASAGIDESNANGNYILWPSNPQKSANEIREYLSKKFGSQNIGVIITDSKTTPLRWGVTAIAIAFSGFTPLKDYIGTKDLFGREFVFEKMSIMDNLACAAAVVMGEGNEQIPIALISDIPFVNFTGADPTEEEVSSLKIPLDKDLYGPILKNAPWKKGADERVAKRARLRSESEDKRGQR